MALPPLELFSLEKRPPCCRVAFSFSSARSSPDLLYARPERRYNPTRYVQTGRADVAQLVEQLIRNQQVIGSSPIVGSILRSSPLRRRTLLSPLDRPQVSHHKALRKRIAGIQNVVGEPRDPGSAADLRDGAQIRANLNFLHQSAVSNSVPSECFRARSRPQEGACPWHAERPFLPMYRCRKVNDPGLLYQVCGSSQAKTPVETISHSFPVSLRVCRGADSCR